MHIKVINVQVAIYDYDEEGNMFTFEDDVVSDIADHIRSVIEFDGYAVQSVSIGEVDSSEIS